MYIIRVYPDAEQVGCLFLEHHPRGFGTVPLDDHIIVINIIHKHNIIRTRAHTQTHKYVLYVCICFSVCVHDVTKWYFSRIPAADPQQTFCLQSDSYSNSSEVVCARTPVSPAESFYISLSHQRARALL